MMHCDDFLQRMSFPKKRYTGRRSSSRFSEIRWIRSPLLLPLLLLLPTLVWGQDLQIAGKIAFESKRDGNYEIYVMNADGTDLTRLTNSSTDDYTSA